ncbi:YihY/virulence factor BrkB family protein [Streptomyces antimicrobicus]|uniref:YihY/virulence factor BrkB family protein n=1 Tax=Streptomyces antimicrobicus TaxID=2883108 RepID=A0ABS8B3P1_9ACTN|nr:YihY/virulence factor BrkB family protein [Streptomyces antimicrobicus]MCB5179225.1 YihY/virulence factor BrkB family protein [Streptomyces antimicrobicus]
MGIGKEPETGAAAEAVSDEGAPDGPSELGARSWRAVLRRTWHEFEDDELFDRAAALTYYSVLSFFPALLVLVSLLGIAGKSATEAILGNLEKLAPGTVRDVVADAVRQLQGSAGLGSLLAVLGLLGAIWSASSYIAAFIRASNAVYDIPEGRPVWKVLPLRLALTTGLMIMACVGMLIVVVTGTLARRTGAALGIGETAVTVWSIAKWPVLVLLATVMIAVLYWAAPNAKGRGFRWLTPGSLLALLIWMLSSAGFAVYIANFGSYNKIYGTLAGVIVFFVWLWITNLAVLLGLEFDAELSRQRAILGGLPPEQEPYVEPRDTSTWPERQNDNHEDGDGRDHKAADADADADGRDRKDVDGDRLA